MSNSDSPWFFNPRKNSQAEYKLFCFPYAGGNASVYLPWVEKLDSQIELIAIQYPGRANRFTEPLVSDMQTMVETISAEIIRFYSRSQLLFFGHSMGGRLAYEVAVKLQNHGIQLCLFMPSGIKAPHNDSDLSNPFYQREALRGGTPIYELSDSAFIEELKFLQGTPNIILNNPDLLEIIMPVLRNDFKLARGCDKARLLERLASPIFSFSGSNDNTVKTEELLHWQQVTSSSYQHFEYSGDHFFINQQQNAITGLINYFVADQQLSMAES